MLDRTLILASEQASASREWFLPRLIRDGAGTIAPHGLPAPIRHGDFLTEYLTRNHNRTFEQRETDPILPHTYEARINRRLGFKSVPGGATFVYWRHTPIARLMPNGSNPHIFITGFHLGTAVALGRAGGSPIRAYQALNPLLAYLMTGLRFTSAKLLAHGAGGANYPSKLRKPAFYIPVKGKGHVRFWEPRWSEMCRNVPVSNRGGDDWDIPLAFDDGTIIAMMREETDLEGLI